ncbi:MAG TPA: exopolysaccharide biosynthesis polyprenyl glycosylphosphotransferase [Candidatus Limiplasma sp.]|nr:exopolysaccharide biosynthesis polyprenyl glycosylphosphotransferase [Candidatus Limiplasma sp.]
MKQRYFRSQILTATFQAALYGFVFLTFFLLLSITNPQIVNYSRTAAITMATFVIVLVILTNVYGGYRLGISKPRSVFFSILITVILTDIVTYIQLQIMNVNPYNNPHLMLLGEDFLLLCSILILQTGIIFFFVKLGHYFYFKINPPERCCIIASSQEQADHIAEKINSFSQKYKLCDMLHYNCDDVYDTIKDHDVIFLSGIPDTEEAQIEAFCYKYGKSMYLLAELEDVIISSSSQIVIDDTPFLYTHRVEPSLIQRFIKRMMDIVISTLGIVLLSPLMLAAAISIKLTSKGPVFFRQERATINGKIFRIIKFRTMYDQNSQSVEESAFENDERITKSGRVLRKYRIDELPQLFNVFTGDMSVVGPRPEMLINVDRYTREVPEFEYRKRMKAGLTGLAQIDGKYNTAPKDKVILDLLYIEQFSLSLDIKLMLRTITVFFRRDSTEGFNPLHKPSPMKMRIRPRNVSTK